MLHAVLPSALAITLMGNICPLRIGPVCQNFTALMMVATANAVHGIRIVSMTQHLYITAMIHKQPASNLGNVNIQIQCPLNGFVNLTSTIQMTVATANVVLGIQIVTGLHSPSSTVRLEWIQSA